MTLALAVAVTSVLVFLAWERHAGQRILPLATYRAGSRLRWVYLTIVVLSAGVGVELFLPLFAQRLAGSSPVVAGFFGAALSLGRPVGQLLAASVRLGILTAVRLNRTTRIPDLRKDTTAVWRRHKVVHERGAADAPPQVESIGSTYLRAALWKVSVRSGREAQATT